jgi:hypothetical protein
MPSKHSTLVPALLLFLAGCSAGAPADAVPPSAKGSGAASKLAAAGDVRASVHLLTTRAPENLQVSKGPVPGSQVSRVQEGFGEVVLAKTNPDGTVSTRCVDSPEGADAFLADTSSPKRAKAAQ